MEAFHDCHDMSWYIMINHVLSWNVTKYHHVMKCHQISSYVMKFHHVKLSDFSWLPSWQMFSNDFQFNMVTFDDMSWCGQSDSERWCPMYNWKKINHLYRKTPNKRPLPINAPSPPPRAQNGSFFNVFGSISGKKGPIFIPQKATERWKCPPWGYQACKRPWAFIRCLTVCASYVAKTIPLLYILANISIVRPSFKNLRVVCNLWTLGKKKNAPQIF